MNDASGGQQLWPALALSPMRLTLATMLLVAYAGLCLWVMRRHRRRLREQPGHSGHSDATGRPTNAPATLDGSQPQTQVRPCVGLLYASQGGQAEALAHQSAQALQQAGCNTWLKPLGQWSPPSAQTTPKAQTLLFIVSTHGDGEPPDNALDFARNCMGETRPELADLPYGLLALGDRDYPRYCGFGVALDQWLQAQKAQSLFDRIEVNQGDPETLKTWFEHIGRRVAGSQLNMAPPSQPLLPWKLVQRRCLNPGSLGAPVYLLDLLLQTGAQPNWQAGDLVQVPAPAPLAAPQSSANSAAKPRTYSIANAPGQGRLQLLVRQHRSPSGRCGLVSGWLTAGLPVGQNLALRLQPNPGFRLPEPPLDSPPEHALLPPLVLIGNGTGMAGLRAHLQARAQALHRHPWRAPALGTWLLFGERSQAHDQFFAQELQQWQDQGVLRQLDLVFSRDTPHAPYVQHRLLQQAARLQLWVQQGATVLVCGSLYGMAAGVEQTMCEVLGEAQVQAMRRAGRLRRDVY
jgi:sulfite reductase (NADPH) flavoprotein alpha-component